MLLEETNDRLMMKDRLPRQATPVLGPGSHSSNEKRWVSDTDQSETGHNHRDIK